MSAATRGEVSDVMTESGSGPFLGVTTFGGDGGVSGIGQYIIQVLGAFARLDPDDGLRFEVNTYPDEVGLFVPDSPRATVRHVSRRFAAPVTNIAWHQSVLPAMAARRGYDALFLPAGNRRVPLAAPCPMIGTVHDFSGIHVADKYDPARMFYIRKVLPFLVRRLDHVLTVSEASAKDIIEFAGVAPEKVTVTPLAADAGVFFPSDRDAARALVKERFGVEDPYFLYISRIEHPGKNHANLIRAFARLKEREDLPHKLLLPGSDRERADEVHAIADACACRDDIVFTGFVANQDVPALYRAAEAFVFPSLYEGFGLPLLEAMACGTPVAAANLSSLPEVAGDAALLFDPYDEDQILVALQRLVFEPELRELLSDKGIARAAGFTWERCAAQTLAAIRAQL